MQQHNLKTAYILSLLIAILAILASIGGLVLDGLYRDNAFVKTTWLGNDAVTLILAAPILICALIFSRRNSLKAQLVWMGMLDYMLYNYAFYLFGSAFNAFFLIYVALVGFSIFALLFGLTNLDASGIARQFKEKTPVKWIGGYFLFVAFGLTFIYTMLSVRFIAMGEIPAIVIQSGHVTNIVFALDLTLLVPWLILGALWLMKRKPWGYVIVGIINVKALLYTFILCVNTVLVLKAGLGSAGELPLWVTLTVLGLIANVLFYGSMVSSQKDGGSGVL